MVVEKMTALPILEMLVEQIEISNKNDFILILKASEGFRRLIKSFKTAGILLERNELFLNIRGSIIANWSDQILQYKLAAFVETFYIINPVLQEHNEILYFLNCIMFALLGLCFVSRRAQLITLGENDKKKF